MRNKVGFTIVELLVVISVLAILASLVTVTYQGTQVKARDAARKTDIARIIQALDNYYLQNGAYPASTCSANCAINAGWSTTVDGSWSNLSALMVPSVMNTLPADPSNMTSTTNPLNSLSTYHYSYFSPSNASYCNGKPAQKLYKLVYRLEGEVQKDTLVGTCDTSSGTAITESTYANASEYLVIR